MIARSTAIPLSQHTQQRLLEILPGALTWFALLVPVVAAFAIRLNDPGMLWILGLGAVLLDAYWLVRTTVTVRGVRQTLKALEATEVIDWWQRCQELEGSLPQGVPAPSEVVQCALIPTYTESYDVLRATVAALVAQNYPEHLRVCAIITRETDLGGIENVTRLREEFAGSFRLFLHIKDPLLPGIVVGKSAAMAYGGPVLKAACDELGLDPARTMVTDLDSDFRLHPQYFAYITFQFCSAQDRLVSIWQPVPVFLNNIWRVPTAVRVMATAATQWQMFLHQHPRRPRDVLLVLDVARSAGERRLLGLRRDPRGLAVLLEGVLPHRRQAQHQAGIPSRVWRCAARTWLCRNPRIAVQPDQAMGMGSDRYPLRHLTNAAVTRRSRGGMRARRYSNLIFNHLTWATLPLLLFFGGALPAFIDLDYSLSSTSALLGSV